MTRPAPAHGLCRLMKPRPGSRNDDSNAEANRYWALRNAFLPAGDRPKDEAWQRILNSEGFTADDPWSDFTDRLARLIATGE